MIEVHFSFLCDKAARVMSNHQAFPAFARVAIHRNVRGKINLCPPLLKKVGTKVERKWRQCGMAPSTSTTCPATSPELVGPKIRSRDPRAGNGSFTPPLGMRRSLAAYSVGSRPFRSDVGHPWEGWCCSTAGQVSGLPSRQGERGTDAGRESVDATGARDPAVEVRVWRARRARSRWRSAWRAARCSFAWPGLPRRG